VSILAQSRRQETLWKSACTPQGLSLDPTAEIGDTAGNLDHATVSMPNGMEFDVSVEGHALKMRLQSDKTWLAAVRWRWWLSTRLPVPASGAEDGARLNTGR
jgi:hypothetical protein